MADKKRKNKPGAGRPPSGRDYRIDCKVLREVGEAMAAAAKQQTWPVLIETLWRESQRGQ